ncbi:MAG: nucleotide modification associated domain-containing protein [Candidatus Micrarchaeaceae archaeon]
MASTKNYSSWERNFEKAVNEIASLSIAHYALSDVVTKLNGLFWSKFKEPKDIEGFADETFFRKLAEIAISGASQMTNKPVPEIGKECYELGVRKNKDYGSDNILKFGTMGVIVRIGDKINRLNNMFKTGTQEVKDEKQLDTLMDIFNYAIYGIMLSRNVWF